MMLARRHNTSNYLKILGHASYVPVDSRRNACQFRQRQPMPWMRSASARPNERGIRLRDLESLHNLSNFDGSESKLNFLDVAILIEPFRQA